MGRKGGEEEESRSDEQEDEVGEEQMSRGRNRRTLGSFILLCDNEHYTSYVDM